MCTLFFYGLEESVIYRIAHEISSTIKAFYVQIVRWRANAPQLVSDCNPNLYY